MNTERDVDFNYRGHTLCAYYYVDDHYPIVSEVWLGDINITELIHDRVYEAAVEACQQSMIDYDAYLYERNEEMRNDQWS